MNTIAFTIRASVLCGIVLCLCSASGPDGDFQRLCQDFFREYIDLKPETGTQLGLPESSGIPVKHDLLDDISPTAVDKVYKLYRKYNKLLSQNDRAGLSAEQRVSCDIFKWFLEQELAMEKYRYHDYTVNPMFGFHNDLTTLMTEHHRITSLKDAKDYISRLKCYEKRLSQVEEQMKIREAKGMMPPVYIVEQTENALNDFISVPPESNVLYTSFIAKLDALQDIDKVEKDDLAKDASNAICDVVYPAYKRISLRLFNLEYQADSSAGVWHLPDGGDYYAKCLRRHTTTGITAKRVHELGLSEVERIQNEISLLYDSLGLPQCTTAGARHVQYWIMTHGEGTEFTYSADEAGRLQTLKDYQKIIDGMSKHLPEMFSIQPTTPVRVERVPQFKEQTMGTYYQQPKLDGSSGGIFYANLSYPHFKPGMKTLAYHEAVPGHHFQLSLEYEYSRSSMIRTLFFFTGFLEGWALYAEKLAGEYGFYDDIHSRIGYLRSELFRAARLVVDTGIHDRKWTRNKAYDYMLETVGWAAYGEIDRYIVWPGQACAYKIGELKILELREKARKALGKKFDIKVFHKVVLQYGSMPLEILEQVVDDFIAGAR
jgi:uncharacterized protein (DUF885 family)